MIALFWLGLILSLVGGLWLIVVAFGESILWGLGTLFIPFVSLIFAVTHWERARQPFLISVAGAVLIMIARFMH